MISILKQRRNKELVSLCVLNPKGFATTSCAFPLPPLHAHPAPELRVRTCVRESGWVASGRLNACVRALRA